VDRRRPVVKCRKCGKKLSNGETFYAVSKVKMIISVLEMIRPQRRMRFCEVCVPEHVKTIFTSTPQTGVVK